MVDDVIFQIRKRGLDQISSPNSPNRTSRGLGFTARIWSLKSDPVRVGGFEMTSHMHVQCTELILIRCSSLKVLPDKKYSPSTYFLGNKYSPSTYFLGSKYSLWEISTPLPSIQYIAFFCLRGLGAIVMFHALFDLESEPDPHPNKKLLRPCLCRRKRFCWMLAK